MMQSKQEIRAVIAAAEAEWPETYFQASDAEIARRVLAIPEWEAARPLFLYVSVRREPDARALVEAALRGGKRVAVPRCLGRGVMEAREIHALDELVPAAYGLLEPKEAAPLVLPGEIDLAVIPCVAADKTGRRLGHGAGFYDRYLAGSAARRLCLCRSRNLLEAVPAEVHDLVMGWVVTEDETLFTGKA